MADGSGAPVSDEELALCAACPAIEESPSGRKHVWANGERLGTQGYMKGGIGRVEELIGVASNFGLQTPHVVVIVVYEML